MSNSLGLPYISFDLGGNRLFLFHPIDYLVYPLRNQFLKVIKASFGLQYYIYGYEGPSQSADAAQVELYTNTYFGQVFVQKYNTTIQYDYFNDKNNNEQINY